jgi:hypothetical protein
MFALAIAMALFIGTELLISRVAGLAVHPRIAHLFAKIWMTPLSAFQMAAYASLYVELIRVNRPLTPEEFSLATPLTYNPR